MTSRGRGNPGKRRDRLYIIAEILQIAKDGALKTPIMYKANLSSTQLEKYLSLLLETKLIKSPIKDGKSFYETTPKGLQLLQIYMEIMELLSGEEAHHLKSRNSLVYVVKNANSPICTIKRYV